MVAQLTGNFCRHCLRQGVAGTSLLPGDAVYTMPETLSLILCNGLVLRMLTPPTSPLSALNPECQDTERSLSGQSTIAWRLGLYFLTGRLSRNQSRLPSTF
jgi:hypothetical protein